MELPSSVLRTLAGEPAIAFVLDLELRICHVNPAWGPSAAQDGAVPAFPDALLGRCYLDFVAGPLREYLERRLAAALAPSSSARGVVLTSECNTPTHFRTLTTHLVPLRASGSETETAGLLVLHSLQVNGLLSEREQLAEDPPDHWRDASGTLLQCSCCRRVKDPHTGSWRMSQALVAQSPPNISHGLCDACLEAYYPEG